ncbi:class I lanthipeptide [Chitinophaga nivalis]|uniref:Class I lanthipeptide n=1 Tax=Chitinophaga nivalis TaxID=2991709 RepID=A0ABT3IQV4_9BACT|nr:class I lanthipeptide [Chitinophaga nivalis]MCW3463963.1 class I lanthipeptide [Chitinophaga nivalis]MCW3486347.1 class I lanthipeptide [Chitinophaga nivalis]
MKKKLNKKLVLSKIQIANLNAADQATLNGGLKITKTIIDPFTSTDPTQQTFCYVCPAESFNICH